MFSHIRRLPSSFSDSILEVIVIDVQKKRVLRSWTLLKMFGITYTTQQKGLVFWVINAETLQTKS